VNANRTLSRQHVLTAKTRRPIPGSATGIRQDPNPFVWMPKNAHNYLFPSKMTQNVARRSQLVVSKKEVAVRPHLKIALTIRRRINVFGTLIKP